MNTYQVPVYRAVITLVFGLQLVVGLVMLTSILRGDLSLVLFALIWWATFAFIGFQFFFRMAYRLEADSDRLLWKSVFRSGSIPLSQLRRVRTRSSVAKFERSLGPPVSIYVGRGFDEFMRVLAEREPRLEIKIGRWARMAEWEVRLPFWRAGKRKTD
jgi:hypothetical protein